MKILIVTRIKKMCREIKDFTNFHMPVLDTRGCKCKTPVKINPMEFIKMLPAIMRVIGPYTATDNV